MKWFNLDRGFGFVILEDGTDAFLHVEALKGAGYDGVGEGDVLRCRVSKGSRGVAVTEVFEVTPHAGSPGERSRQGPEVTGTIKFFSRAGQYGFIERAGGRDDVYLSLRCLSRSGVMSVRPGQRVVATTLVGERGLIAEHIREADES